MITVPTPLKDGLPDLSCIEEASRELGRFVTPGSVVILESTTYPGTTTELLCPILEAASGLVAGKDFAVGYSPERIDPGNAIWSLRNTPKVVSGIDEVSRRRVQDFYASIVDETVPVSSCQVAELTKLLENTFRHVNIALVNELAIFAHDMNVDVWEAIEAADSKPFGYLKFRPGPGVGGHCLPVDPSYLSWRAKRDSGRSFRFVELANDVNDHMPEYVLRRITGLLNDRRKPVRGSRLLLLGLAYKANTSDTRESPALRLAELLVKQGAEVQAADPHVDWGRIGVPISQVDDLAAAASKVDLAVLLTPHDRFDYDALDLAEVILDTCGRLGPADNVVRL